MALGLRAQSLSQTFPTPIDDVWSAVTDPDRLPRWFAPVTGELRLGGRYQVEGNAGGEVLECEAPIDGSAHFRVTWEFAGAISWLTVRLQEEAGATSLELEHTAAVADEPSEFWDTYGPGATGVGWDGGLLGLALLLGATEGSLSPAEAEAWADIASGTEAAAAEQRAGATHAFFTGTGD